VNSARKKKQLMALAPKKDRTVGTLEMMRKAPSNSHPGWGFQSAVPQFPMSPTKGFPLAVRIWPFLLVLVYVAAGQLEVDPGNKPGNFVNGNGGHRL